MPDNPVELWVRDVCQGKADMGPAIEPPSKHPSRSQRDGS